MSYNKRTWATGNVVGAVDLNRMEQGIEDASGGGAEPLILEWDSETYTSNKTWQEVYNALASGVPCYMRSTSPTNAALQPIIRALANIAESTYSIYVLDADDESSTVMQFSTDAPNNYFED